MNSRRLIASLVLSVALTAVPGCTSKSPSLVPVSVAWSPFESLGLYYVALDQGFFKANGLSITERKYDSGSGALSGMLAGEADIVVGTTEFPLVNQALRQASLKSIAVIAKSDFIYVVARKDRGIQNTADLKGKRVGTTFGTIAEFYLGRLLELNGLSTKDITEVDLKTPDEWVNAVSTGVVDAVCTAQPSADSAAKLLGSNAVMWSAQSSQSLFAQAIASTSWLAANQDLAEKFLRALDQAATYIVSHPSEAKSSVQSRLNVEATYVEAAWPRNHYALSLDQSLITAMEDESRWLIQNNLTTATSTPTFVNYIDETALKKVKPGAVRIIR